jgi:putative spermidine/putrescine transport system permease protein
MDEQPKADGTVATSAEASATPPAGFRRRLAGTLHRHSTTRVAGLLAAPSAWLLVVYLGSLLFLFLNAFWQRDPFTGLVVRQFTLDNFVELIQGPTYWLITLRTVGMAAAVTITCALLAFPIAYYMARIASSRTRGLLVVAVLMPLWASYLVKAYTWRLILSNDGVLNWLLQPLGITGPGLGDNLIGPWLVFTYLWLPYMILPVYAGLERIPTSMLEASADLGGRSWMTFRRVILPLTMPAVLAGSIFTFSLTLGDYIVPGLISLTQFIGNTIYANFGAGDFPFAAAFALVPLGIMTLYLVVARRLGAFEAL